MNKTKTLLIWLCLLLSAMSELYAQKVGSTSMQFLHVMPGARATGMGDAYSVLASGADAVFWNPSGLVMTEKQEISTTYVDWLLDTQQGAVSYALQVSENQAVGAQIQYVDYGEFEETRADRPYINNPTGPGYTYNTFHPFSFLAGISYATNFTDKFALGVSMKYAHESLFDGTIVNTMVREDVYEDVKTWADVLLFDIGIRYKTGYRSVQIGAAVQNFGPNVKFALQSFPAPLLFRLGVAADLVGSDALLVSTEQNNNIRFAFDLFQPNDYDQQQHVGLEYEFQKSFALRVGYKFHYDTEGLTLGGGVQHMLGTVRLKFDYSYGTMGEYLGNIQRISLGAVLP